MGRGVPSLDAGPYNYRKVCNGCFLVTIEIIKKTVLVREEECQALKREYLTIF